MNAPTCKNCKELNKYLPILTEEFYRVTKNGKNIFKAKFNQDEIMLGREVYNFYPAPTLEELLKASPIVFHLMNFLGNKIAFDTYFHGKYLVIQITKSENLCNNIAKIILKYYKELK